MERLIEQIPQKSNRNKRYLLPPASFLFANPSSLSSDFAREAAAPSLPPEVCFTKETNSENPQESTRELLLLLILDQLPEERVRNPIQIPKIIQD